MRTLVLRWLINAVALYAAAYVVRGIHYGGQWWGFLIMAVIFGFVNAIIRPILRLLTCPLIILTLGFFTLVINALMLWLLSWLASVLERQTNLGFTFRVDGFMPAFWGALIISIVSFVLTMFLHEDRDDRRR